MDAQSMLVRYCRFERNRFALNVAKRERQAIFSASGISWFVLVFATICQLSQVQAQGYAPFPVQQAGASQPPQYYSPNVAGNYCPPTDPAAYAQLVPDHRFGPPGHEKLFHDLCDQHLSGSWIRLEYWHARTALTGGGAIGTSINDINGNLIRDTTVPFDVPVFPVLMLPTLINSPGVAPNSNDVDWDNIQGIKGSFGIPLDDRTSLEATFRGLQEQESSLGAPRIPALTTLPINGIIPPQVIVIPYTLDGQPGSLNTIPNTAIVYDADFFSQYTTNFWAADVNQVYDLRIPHDGWTLQSIIGWRHEEYSEGLVFGGTFDNRSGYATDGTVNTGLLVTPQTNRIESKVHNFRHAIQLGFRSELKTHRLTLGIEPKVALGIGLVRSRVNTQNAREPGDLSALLQDPNFLIDDPDSTTSFDREINFAPSAELNLYAKCDVTEWLKLRVGVDLLWLGQVGSADNSIRFNTISAVDPLVQTPILDFGVNQKLNNRYITAFTVGGEITFP